MYSIPEQQEKTDLLSFKYDGLSARCPGNCQCSCDCNCDCPKEGTCNCSCSSASSYTENIVERIVNLKK